MNEIFHKGEYYIQEVMGVRKSADTLSSNIKDTIPNIAAQFLENLNFCVISLSLKNKKQFTFIVYDISPFIKVNDYKTIKVNLKYHTYIPKEFIHTNEADIGLIALDFESKMRLRLNGKVNINEKELEIRINQIYSNCPKYIAKKYLHNELKIKEKQEVERFKHLSVDLITLISNCDTFFIASMHETYGLDVSYKGGKKGFISIKSKDTLEFIDLPGNNLFNTLGNIYINPNIQLIFINFTRGDIYYINGTADIIESENELNKSLIISIKCEDIILNKNGFLLDYKEFK